jgi:hypothetical protein
MGQKKKQTETANTCKKNETPEIPRDGAEPLLNIKSLALLDLSDGGRPVHMQEALHAALFENRIHIQHSKTDNRCSSPSFEGRNASKEKVSL